MKEVNDANTATLAAPFCGPADLPDAARIGDDVACIRCGGEVELKETKLLIGEEMSDSG